MTAEATGSTLESPAADIAGSAAPALDPASIGAAIGALLLAVAVWRLLALWRARRNRRFHLARDEARAEQDRARTLALLDATTRLPNRHALLRDFALCVARAQRAGASFDLYCVQIDPAIGQDAESLGASAVMAVNQRLRGLCRRGDVLGRYSEQLFVLLRFRCAPDDDPAWFCQYLRQQVGQPLLTGTGAAPLPLVVGGATYCAQRSTLQQLIRAALHPDFVAPPAARRRRPALADNDAAEATSDHALG